MKPTIERVQHGSRLEKQLVLFVQDCSWNEVKEHLLRELETWDHEEWESFFVAFSDEKIIGMISILKEDYYPLPGISPWLSSIFVSENYRGQGICGQMIEYVNAYAREQGFQKTYIPSIHTGLYEKYGYVYLRDIVNYGGGTDRLYVRELLCEPDDPEGILSHSL